MCGICAFIGYTDGFKPTYDGLCMLQNRGYDSAGICGIDANNNFVVEKKASTDKLNSVEHLLTIENRMKNVNVIIAHQRWATHGAKTDENAHPHTDFSGKFSIVHNGIIENYQDIKTYLIDEHHVEFSSQTDTEVIVNLIGVLYKEYNNVEKAFSEALNRMEGTWGLVLLCKDTPNKMYVARHGSPLLVGFGENFMMIASEQSGFCRYVNNYICLNDNDVVVLQKKDGKVVFNQEHQYHVRQVTAETGSLTPYPFKHWTIKEIYEQSDAVLRSMGMGGRICNGHCVRLGGLMSHKKELIDINHLILLGCGTSYHAGLFASHIFKQICDFETVQVFDGGDFTWLDVPKTGKTGLIMISQSGETKDLHRALEIGRDKGLNMIGVVNVVDSMIAREVNCGVYLNAGREVAVASTKAFTCQVVVLYMIAVWFSQNRNINELKRAKIVECLRRLPIDIRKTIETHDSLCQQLAEKIKDNHSLFVLGKGTCEAVAKEGALKIKEIAYIHAEGLSSTCMKHGTYGTLDPDTPVIVNMPDDEHFVRNCGIVEELASRGAYIIGISNKDLSKTKCNVTIKVPNNVVFASILGNLPVQLIAYYTSITKGNDCDKPRNLAKVVTVD